MRIRRGLGRVGQYLLVLWAALSLNFFLPHLAPGNPIDYLAGEATLTSAEREELLASYGLDRSVGHQYAAYWGQALTGQLGTSVRFNEPVTHLLASHLPWTLLLLGAGLLASTLVGGLAGALAGLKRGGRVDVGFLVAVIALDALPGFLVALALVAVFSVELGWLPSFGAAALGGPDALTFPDVARRLLLPATALTLATLGPAFLLARGAVIGLGHSGFIRMAIAKGAGPGRVFFRHLLRNALLPVTSNLAIRVGAVFSGAVVIETVFGYPGVGRLVYEAVLARDYPLLRGAFLLSVFGVVLANLVADLVLPILDPRIRSAPARAA